MKLIKKRQVRNKYIYVAFASLVLMCLSYYGYHRFKIGYGIAIESRHYFKKAKAFFFNYEFFGNRCIFAPEKETKTITITS